MKWYRIRLQLSSWYATPWLADTIFGHLCWGLRYLHSEEALGDFLRRYDQGKPPLLLSNGFPGDYLPCPIVDLPQIDAAVPLDKRKEQFDLERKRRKLDMVSWEQFNEIIATGKLRIVGDDEDSRLPARRVTLKNQLNRITNTTGGDGTLYSFDEYFCPEIVLYTKIADDFLETCKELFCYLTDTGFGKRKSSGYGQVTKVSFEQFDGFSVPTNANGFVTLSHFVPAAHDPCHGSWRVTVKYGRMGEDRAIGGSVFKKPLVVLSAGSTFYDSPCREYYGRMVRGLNPAYLDAVQYGLALPVPMRLPG